MGFLTDDKRSANALGIVNFMSGKGPWGLMFIDLIASYELN
jgi:hypothetical protein